MEAELQHEPDNNSQQEHEEHEEHEEQSSSDEELEEAHTRSSHVWSYFTRDPNFKENKKATCNMCKQTYTCSGGSTSNLSRHLQNRHNLRTKNSQQQGLDIRDAFNNSKTKKVMYLIFCFIVLFKIFL
jgi:hypothetical protein